MSATADPRNVSIAPNTRTVPLTPSSWLRPTEISHLTPQAIKEFLGEGHRKGGGQLRQAYETAQDPTEWDAAQAEFRRKKEVAEGEVDELADEDEEDDVETSGGKRKRVAGDKKAKAKKAKTAKKVSDQLAGTFFIAEPALPVVHELTIVCR